MSTDTKCKIEIKNHSDFKRICQKGKVKFETLALTNNPVPNGRLYVGMIRSIKRADTTGVYLVSEGDTGSGSFLGFDKASDWVFESNVATNIVWGYSYRLLEG